jgi:hypothetical protein
MKERNEGVKMDIGTEGIGVWGRKERNKGVKWVKERNRGVKETEIIRSDYERAFPVVILNINKYKIPTCI